MKLIQIKIRILQEALRTSERGVYNQQAAPKEKKRGKQTLIACPTNLISSSPPAFAAS